MQLTTQTLEAVEKAAVEDMTEDISKAEKNRLIALVKASSAVRADITVAEIRTKSQLTLAEMKS